MIACLPVRASCPLPAAVLLCTLSSAGCVRRAPPPSAAAPRALLLLAEAPALETSQRTETRNDVEVDTRDFERTPRVVARGETVPLSLDGARARLYGDAEGTRGWSVDNFVLFEVVDAQDRVTARFACGFSDGVMVGPEQVDLVGPQSFTFGPGEVDVSQFLPESGRFRLRATALDYQGVGRTEALYLRLEPRASPSEGDGE